MTCGDPALCGILSELNVLCNCDEFYDASSNTTGAYKVKMIECAMSVNWRHDGLRFLPMVLTDIDIESEMVDSVEGMIVCWKAVGFLEWIFEIKFKYKYNGRDKVFML